MIVLRRHGPHRISDEFDNRWPMIAIIYRIVMPGTQSSLRRLRKLVCAAGHPS
jgi:hypothetical protein